MASIWRTKDKRPKYNTLEAEVARLKRIINALSIAVLEKRFNHVERDIQELLRCHEELEYLIKESLHEDIID